jgi:hypothetical protein
MTTHDLQATDAAEKFYAEILQTLNETKIPFMIGGTYALHAHTGINRPTKDIDIFCKAGDYPKIVGEFSQRGYKAEVTDERWIARIIKGKHFFDMIFNSANGATPVSDDWFTNAKKTKIYGIEVTVLPPTEFIWSKLFIQNRLRYDGHDIVHAILKNDKAIDWKRLLSYSEQYWEVLLVHILNFRFIYPSEREHIPKWLFNELRSRLEHQANLPTQETKICRGRLLSRDDFYIDIAEWGFEDYVALK